MLWICSQFRTPAYKKKWKSARGILYKWNGYLTKWNALIPSHDSLCCFLVFLVIIVRRITQYIEPVSFPNNCCIATPLHLRQSVTLKEATSRFAHLEKFSLHFFQVRRLQISVLIFSILVTLWFIIISLVFFYFSLILFSGFLQFKVIL